jgi:hypothetical protein
MGGEVEMFYTCQNHEYCQQMSARPKLYHGFGRCETMSTPYVSDNESYV